MLIMLYCRVDTRRTNKSPVTFDFNIRTAAKLNKITEFYWKKQIEEEQSQQSEDHHVKQQS